MIWVLCAALPVAALIVLALIGVDVLQARARTRVRNRVLMLDLGATRHQSLMLDYFDSVAQVASIWRALANQLIAPFVLLIPLMRLPRAANDLPASLAYWRNNVGINGDGWSWQSADGRWHQCREEPAPEGITPVKYDDPAYGGDAYYAPGHHPRSAYARWIWLAFRNVATARMQDAGPLIETRPVLLAGSLPLGTDAEGFALLWNGVDGVGTAYQWRSVDRWGPLALWTNVGAKLDIPYQWPEILPARAMLTGTWCAIKRWKGTGI